MWIVYLQRGLLAPCLFQEDRCDDTNLSEIAICSVEVGKARIGSRVHFKWTCMQQP